MSNLILSEAKMNVALDKFHEMERRIFEEPTPRRYQIEVLEIAIEQNTIVCLQTGCGKTLIAVLLIRKLSHLFRKPANGICVFLAPTVCLCNQQADVIEKYTDLHVARFSGGIIEWKDESWKAYMDKYEVFVMTPEILLRSLRHGFVKSDAIELFIFDECHHASKSHPYASIMTEYYHGHDTKTPRILGMTASPINRKCRTSNGAPALENEIHDLEKMLLSKVCTKDDEELHRYLPTSNLKIRRYNSGYPNDSVEYVCQEKLHRLFETATRTLMECMRMDDMRSLNRINLSLARCLLQLGPWCAKQAAQVYFDSHKDDSVFRDTLRSAMDIIDLSRLEGGTEQQSNKIECLGISSKVQLLLDLLGEYEECRDLTCIVFVEEVITANVLSLLLNRETSIRCKCLTSHRAIATPTPGKSRTSQKSAIEDFRSGKISLLVATNVAEEGLDIQSCFLVIRFDLPKTERSQIQSRGRARRAGSDYVVFLRYDEQDLLDSLLEGEKMMYEQIHDSNPFRRDHMEYSSKGCYQVASTGATVNVDSSISLLHQYCSSLITDGSKRPEYHCSHGSNGFVCTIQLPDNAQVRKVTGPESGSEDMAKRSASVEACKQLHMMGALNDHLLPSSSSSSRYKPNKRQVTDTELHETCTPDVRRDALAENCLELHETYTPDALRGNVHIASATISLYAQEISIVSSDDKKQYRSFGLFLPTYLDSSNFDLDLGSSRKAHIELLPAGSIVFDESKISLAKCFHEKFYASLLGGCHTHMFSPIWHASYSYFLLPLSANRSDGRDIDWECIQRVATPTILSKEDDTLTLTLANCSLSPTDVEGAVVVTKHNDPPIVYYIVDTLHNMTSFSPFTNSTYASYFDYFSSRHNTILAYPEQPLLQAKRLVIAQNFIVRKTGSVASSSNTSWELPPELCTVWIAGISSCILNSVGLLPSIMHRLEGLLVATQLNNKIAGDNAGHLRISATTMLTALTPASCNEEFSLERLEFLGDSFLKIAVSLQLYAAHPDKAEGYLSNKRAVEISNSHLRRLAISKNIPVYIRERFDPYYWVVPGFSRRVECQHSAEESLNQALALTCNKGHRLLSIKGIADVVEAMIGGFIVDDCASAAYKLMVWLGLELITEFTLPISLQHISDRKLEGLEKAIGYSFTNKGLLIEAFTHASYDKLSYQRLEYLGDAILDYLVVLYMYAAFPLLEPGELTDLKCATVNNEWLAFVAVRHKFHKFLFHSCEGLGKEIEGFLSRNNGNFEEWQVDKPPKVLSDMVESLVAALFLDSQGDLTVVWNVLKPLLEPIASPESLVLHPVTELQELCQLEGFSVEYFQKTDPHELHCNVKLSECSVVGISVAKSKRNAKKQAAADALIELKAHKFEHPRHKLVVAVNSSGPCLNDSLISKGLNLNVTISLRNREKEEAPSNFCSNENSAFTEDITTVLDGLCIADIESIERATSSTAQGTTRTVSSVLSSASDCSNDFLDDKRNKSRDVTTALDGVRFEGTTAQDTVSSFQLQKLDSVSVNEPHCRNGFLGDKRKENRDVAVLGFPRARLKEFCDKRRWDIEYNCLSEQGPSHLKQFTYVVSLTLSTERMDFEGDPEPRKDKAKDSAAQYALDWLIESW